MLKAPLRSSLSVILLCGNVGLAAQQNAGKTMAYENHNQIDYGPLKVGSIAGVANDDGGVVIPGVTIGVFTELDHALVATTEIDSKGAFFLAHISPGRYRLIAKYDGFCPANVPIVVKRKYHWRSRNSLNLHMRPGGIDTCSYGSLK